MTINRAMRASDQDREHVVEILRSQFAEGRLTHDEFEERMSMAYAGKTWGDLLALTTDLPVPVRLGADRAAAGTGLPAGPPAPPAGPPWPVRLVPLVPLLIAAVFLSSLAWGFGPHHHMAGFFPIWPVLLIFLILRGTRHRGGRYR